jgi:hypothetical protein
MIGPFRRLAFGLLACLACSSSSDPAASGGGGGSGAGAGGAGGSGGGGSTGTLAYKPCDPNNRAGLFSVSLVQSDDTPSFTAFQGGVKNGIDPTRAWDESAKEGDCRVLKGRMLVCSTPCAVGKVCAGSNMCVDEPTTQDTGTVTVTGLGATQTVSFIAGQGYYATLPAGTAFPPFAPDAQVLLKSTGGKYPALSLAGRGVEPLEFAGTGLLIARGKPLAVSWTAPKKAGSSRIHVSMDIAHHGGIASRLECDVADTGSTTVPATLINKLLDQGMAGFPSINLTRQTLDSTMLAPGCVEFAVASARERSLDVEGVISCTGNPPCPDGEKCTFCPMGQTCQTNLSCK